MADLQSPQNKQNSGNSSSGSGKPRGAGSRVPVMLGKHIQIFPDKPLDYYNHGSVRAFEAVEKVGAEEFKCLAYVCEPSLVPRRNGATYYKNIQSPALLKLVNSGVVDWSGEAQGQEQRFVFVYRHDLGKRVCEDQGALCLGWRQDKMMAIIFKSLLPLMNDLKNGGFYHGSISPANMFFSAHDENQIILGDCLSVPASSFQPALVQPLEIGILDRFSAGVRGIKEDLYSLGASLALAIRSPDRPFGDISKEEIIREKLEVGSFTFLVGRERLSVPMQDVLKGLLHDDPEQRWGIDELYSWVDGKRIGGHNSVKVKKASRGFTYARKNYFYPNLLACDLGADPEKFVQLVRDEQLEQWLTRSVDDKEVLERYHAALKYAKGQGGGKAFQDSLLCHMRIALMPEYPLSYKGRTFDYRGSGNALASAFVRGDDLKIFHEIFESGLFLNWLYLQPEQKSAHGRWIKKFDLCRVYIKSLKAGQGLERCLYILSDNVQCLSPKLENYYVISAQDLLLALEDMASKNQISDSFLDRHCLAFLAELDNRVVEGCLYDLNSADKPRQILGSLRCLAHIQKRYKVESVVHLSQLFAKRLTSVYARYRDKGIQNKVRAGVEQFAKKGDLIGMVTELDNTSAIERDEKNFLQAKYEYQALSAEHETISKSLKQEADFGLQDAHEFTAMFACVLAFVIAAYIFVAFFSGSGLF